MIDCAPEPAELLVTDTFIRIHVNYAINLSYLLSAEGVSLISRTAVGPKRVKTELTSFRRQNIKQFVLVHLVIGLIEFLQQSELNQRQFVEEFYK